MGVLCSVRTERAVSRAQNASLAAEFFRMMPQLALHTDKNGIFSTRSKAAEKDDQSSSCHFVPAATTASMGTWWPCCLLFEQNRILWSLSDLRGLLMMAPIGREVYPWCPEDLRNVNWRDLTPGEYFLKDRGGIVFWDIGGEWFLPVLFSLIYCDVNSLCPHSATMDWSTGHALQASWTEPVKLWAQG